MKKITVILVALMLFSSSAKAGFGEYIKPFKDVALMPGTALVTNFITIVVMIYTTYNLKKENAKIKKNMEFLQEENAKLAEVNRRLLKGIRHDQKEELINKSK